MPTTASDGNLALIGSWASPFVIRSKIALNIKSLEYEFLQEKIGEKSEMLLKYNPVYKKMPVLIHGDKPVCESMIILQYIDEVWPSAGPAILPHDPFERANARFWATYIDDKWVPALFAITKAQCKEAKKEAADQLDEGLGLLEGAFEKCSKGKPFFGGDKVGYIDLALGSFLSWMRVVERVNGITILDKEKTPKLAEWAEVFVADKDVMGVMPETEKLMEYVNILFDKLGIKARA